MVWLAASDDELLAELAPPDPAHWLGPPLDNEPPGTFVELGAVGGGLVVSVAVPWSVEPPGR